MASLSAPSGAKLCKHKGSFSNYRDIDSNGNVGLTKLELELHRQVGIISSFNSVKSPQIPVFLVSRRQQHTVGAKNSFNIQVTMTTKKGFTASQQQEHKNKNVVDWMD